MKIKVLLVIGVLCAASAQADVWIKAGTSAGGTGTADDPYVVRTTVPDDLDDLLASLSSLRLRFSLVVFQPSISRLRISAETEGA